MAVIENVKEAQARSLEGMKTVQEQVVAFNERIADSVLGAIPNYDSPFADYLPKPAEMVDTYFGFVNDMHQANRDFMSRLADIWDRSEEPVAATKATAKKK